MSLLMVGALETDGSLIYTQTHSIILLLIFNAPKSTLNLPQAFKTDPVNLDGHQTHETLSMPPHFQCLLERKQGYFIKTN